jgi:hypothetical protein
MTEKEHLNMILREMLIMLKYLMFIYVSTHRPEHLDEFCKVADIDKEKLGTLNKALTDLNPEIKNKKVCIQRILMHIKLMENSFPALNHEDTNQILEKFGFNECVN